MALDEVRWQSAYKTEKSRKRGDFITYRVSEAHNREAYRIVWVHSSSQAQSDAAKRDAQIQTADSNLQAL